MIVKSFFSAAPEKLGSCLSISCESEALSKTLGDCF